jgi:hypothetical protein
VLGFDFSVFWDTGRALLEGRDPYSVQLSAYPPAAAYLYALFALIPFAYAFPLWCGANVLFLFDLLRRRGLARQFPAWLAATPAWFVLFTGQIDLFYLWVSGFVLGDGPWAVPAAALVTLKPQVAFVVLPWHLLRWLREAPRRVLAWAGLCLVLHGFPLLLNPAIYTRWFAVLRSQAGWRAQISTGLFLFSNIGVPVWLLAILAGGAALWGLTRGKETARAALLLAQPAGVWYEDVLLTASAPWQLFLPLTWAAFILATLFRNSLPFLLIPLGVIFWREFLPLLRSRRKNPL